MTRPAVLFARTADELGTKADAALAQARRNLREILRVQGRRTIANTLLPYDEVFRTAQEVAFQAEIVFNAHPDASLRAAGQKAHQLAKTFLADLNLNRSVYEAFASLRVPRADAETRHTVFKVLRDFRRAGVDKDEPTRARIKALNDEIIAICSEFDKTAAEVRSIKVESPERLAGLPQDYIEAHPPKEGTITITTQYPDALPIFQYATDAEVRRTLRYEFDNRGYPKNLDLLDRLRARRHELARLLGYRNYADYVTGSNMVDSAKAVASFIERVSKVSEARLKKDLRSLLELKREDDPAATRLERWDVSFYTERLRRTRYAFDSQEARPYFAVDRVREGLFAITQELFGVRYRRVRNPPIWHEAVEAYDVYNGETRLGRFYLDLHPREGKYTHARMSAITLGLLGRQLPQAVLLCNFADPRKASGPALMEHRDVVTFFHEFGHLLHHVFCGRVKWAKSSIFETEFDFGEVQSTVFEEWATNPESLRRFARHHATGEPIPEALLGRMTRASSAARGTWVRINVLYAALSLAYHDRDPAAVDTTDLVRELSERYYPVRFYEGTHFQCSFFHLTEYSAMYYTYLWSEAIEKDLFLQFQKKPSIMDRLQARKLRRLILDPGGSIPAAKMVRDYLGRPPRLDAYRAWVNEGG